MIKMRKLRKSLKKYFRVVNPPYFYYGLQKKIKIATKKRNPEYPELKNLGLSLYFNMFQETITPDTPLGDTERILTQAPISRDQKVTKQSTIPTGIKLKTVETLLIEDAAEVQGIQGQRVPHDQDIASQFPKYTREGAELERVNSWDEFLKALLKYETFDRLVLLFHRIPGSIAI